MPTVKTPLLKQINAKRCILLANGHNIEDGTLLSLSTLSLLLIDLEQVNFSMY